MSFNPILSFSGNGIPNSVVITYTTGTSYWNIATFNLPGQALTGTFPTVRNPNTITSQSISATTPYRGGKNLQAVNHVKSPNNIIGITSIGVLLFSPGNGQRTTGGSGTVWNLNAAVAKIFDEDIYGGAPIQGGVYNYRDNSFIRNNAWGSITGSTWSGGSYVDPSGHSKIVGWAIDGYPIYGPYGYINPVESGSGVTRMVSGYRQISLPTRPSSRTLVSSVTVSGSRTFNVYSVAGIGAGMDLTGLAITTATKILSIFGTQLTVDNPVTFTSGAVLNASYRPGIFLEDWVYSPIASTTLDSYNGRYCVTPEFPNGTYAYFTTQDSLGVPTYPYLVGPTFYGSLTIDSNDTTLSSLTPSIGSLVPTFSSATRSYSLTVQNLTTSVQFTSVVNSPLSTLRINNTPIASGSLSSPISLAVGINTSTISVTSQYLSTGTYTVSVERLRSGINTLRSLSIGRGTLSPAFNKEVLSYSVTYDKTVTSISITAIKDDVNSNIQINGPVVNGPTSARTVALEFGINVITISVTAQNGNIKNYVIQATRLSDVSSLSNIVVDPGTLTPAFQTQIYSYIVNVPYSQNSILLKAIVIDALSVMSINGVQTPSNQNTLPIPLSSGNNAIGIIVTSSNAETRHTYRVTVVRAFNNDATLSSLSFNYGTLSPVFSSGVTTYTLSVPNNISNITRSAITTDPTATIIGNGIIPLSVGVNNINVTVIAADRVTQKIYNIAVTRAGSTVSTLDGLFVNGSILQPQFATTTYEYTGTVAHTISSTSVVPITTDQNANIKVNNVSVLSGSNSQLILLNVGHNTINTVVTAQDNITTSTYIVDLVRKANYDATLSYLDITTAIINFDKSIKTYNISQPYTVSSIDITLFATDVGVSSIVIDNETTSTSVTSGSTTSIQLKGSIVDRQWRGLTVITITITAADQESTEQYVINVNRLPIVVSTLSNLICSLGPLNPVFSPTTTEYFYNIPYLTTATTITATVSNPLSSVSFNIAPIESGVPYGPIGLNVGNNNLPLVVSSADGSQITGYNIYVNRAALGLSTNDNLSSVTLSNGTLSPAFNKNISTYAVTLEYAVSSIKITPIKEETNASIKINGIAVISGGTSSDINVPVGSSQILIEVTAQDNTTKKTYTINVSRVGSTDSSLKDLLVSAGQLDKMFSKNTYHYTVTLSNDVSSISVKPVVNEINAQTNINDVGIATDDWSTPVSLITGTNVYSILVMAGDLIHKTIYQLTVIRSPYIPIDIPPGPVYKSTGITWITPAGFIATASESRFITRQLSALGDIPEVGIEITNLMNFAGQSTVGTNVVNVGFGNPDWGITIGQAPTDYEIIFNGGRKATITGISSIGAILPGSEWSLTGVWPANATGAPFTVRYKQHAPAKPVTYTLISGALPSGLSIANNGIISGIPSIVYQTVRSEFVIRASNTVTVADRKFYIDVLGATPPVITTPGPIPRIGPSNETWLVNGQIVDFQFTGTADIIPPGKKLVFFIADGDGELPPGLELSEDGRLYGTVVDNLSLPYQAATNGNYDEEGYDIQPYEHDSTEQFGLATNSRFINKIYKFYLSLSNGVGVFRATYTIPVNDPNYYFTLPSQYPVALQWLTPTNLGEVRCNTYQNITLNTHDCDPGGGSISYGYSINNNEFDLLPPGLNLDPVTGVIFGFIPYTPVYSTTYSFKLAVTKNNVLTGTNNYRDRTFTITVLGAVYGSVSFVSSSNLGTISQGVQSELSVVAKHTNSSIGITYVLSSGSLPPGLSLAIDGAIQGTVPYNPSQLSDTKYTFIIKALDTNHTEEIQSSFSITVAGYAEKEYTNIVFRPLLSLATRDFYSKFINDQFIFEKTLLYRPYDPAFGTQTNLEFVLEHGIEKRALDDYVPALQQYFSRRRLEFGDLKISSAVDDTNKVIYDVIYIELIDKFVNSSGVSVGSEIVTINGETLYPESIDNMRTALESVAPYDEYLLPKFMRTIQTDTGIPLGRILCMPLCYCLPGNSKIILNRIKNYGIDFKQINFDIDRLIILDTTDNTTAKYLLFPHRKV